MAGIRAVTIEDILKALPRVRFAGYQQQPFMPLSDQRFGFVFYFVLGQYPAHDILVF
jgi:hypothetical protein